MKHSLLCVLLLFLPLQSIVHINPYPLEVYFSDELDFTPTTKKISTDIQPRNTQEFFSGHVLCEVISASFDNHNPIFIDGNDDFIAQATAEGWPGDGSEEHPIIIADLKITFAGNLIMILNTDLFFQIHNCILDGLGKGRGISIHSSSNGLIVNNTVRNIESVGIYVEHSSNIIITRNIVHNSVQNEGIFLWEANYNVISQNYVYDNVLIGIVCHLSHHNRLINNTVSYNSFGISTNSNNNIIINNSIFNNDEVGLWFEEGSSNNIAEGNNFANNFLTNYPQAIDEGSDNIFQYNYWNDWTTPDANNDGIVDNPYIIDGSANNEDPFPLTTLHIQTTIHAIYHPAIIYPNGGETLKGISTIYWAPSYDPFGHLITYSVYYSADSGNGWALLVSSLTTTNFEWNTSAVVDGTTYLIKVVATCSEGLTQEDISDGTFTIRNGPSFLELITSLIIWAFVIILGIVVFTVGILSLRKFPSKIEEPVVQSESSVGEPIITRKFPKPRTSKEKDSLLVKIPNFKESFKPMMSTRPVEPLITPDSEPANETEPLSPSRKPIDELKKSYFSSIQYQVQDLLFEQDDTCFIARLIPYSGSIKEIMVKIAQNQIKISGCLKRENLPLVNLELRIDGEPKEPSWSDPWQDISLLGEEKIIKRIKIRSEIANRMNSLGTVFIKFESQTKGKICFQLICNETENSVKLAHSLIKDLQLFFEISLY